MFFFFFYPNSWYNLKTFLSTGPTSNCSIIRGYCPNCGIAPISVDGIKIVNGTLAAENEYPYQVVISSDIGNCGGSIIKKKWVLTAAHCLANSDGNKATLSTLKVGYGSSNRQDQISVSVVRYIVHENFNPFLAGDQLLLGDSDIALIELQSELNFETSAAVKPICLGEESDIVSGRQAVVSGWGDLFSGAGDLQIHLREVALEVLSTSYCKALSQRPDVSKVVCTLKMSKSFCQGDSGGPLVVKTCLGTWVQIGIVSYASGCADKNHPGVYTRVPSFRTWIDTQTGSSTAC
ncbi:trypsin-like [Macrobrachium rosenbergii]|uniref:trypsin-like n=1 Tax=Macrobrachium rosenbergii TaxID=79674 RepID=UPI0034D5EB4E